MAPIPKTTPENNKNPFTIKQLQKPQTAMDNIYRFFTPVFFAIKNEKFFSINGLQLTPRGWPARLLYNIYSSLSRSTPALIQQPKGKT